MKKTFIVLSAIVGIVLSLPAVAIAVASFYIRGGDAMGKYLLDEVKKNLKKNA